MLHQNFGIRYAMSNDVWSRLEFIVFTVSDIRWFYATPMCVQSSFWSGLASMVSNWHSSTPCGSSNQVDMFCMNVRAFIRLLPHPFFDSVLSLHWLQENEACGRYEMEEAERICSCSTFYGAEHFIAESHCFSRIFTLWVLCDLSCMAFWSEQHSWWSYNDSKTIAYLVFH